MENQVQLSLGEIATRLDGVLSGPSDKLINGVSPIPSAGPDEITFLDDLKYLPKVEKCRAGAILVGRDVAVPSGPPMIRVDEPLCAFAELLSVFFPRRPSGVGVSPRAHVAEDAQVGAGSSVHAGAYVGTGARIGENTEIFPGVYVGDRVKVGSDCLIHANVSIYHDCEIGDRVILHSGVVIGADGFGYAQKKQEDPREPIVHLKLPQVGKVVIEDDVEIGANSTVDRAALEVTRIGRGTKIDNLVMVAHNCDIGCHTILVSQVGVSGSTKLGNYVKAAGQAGLVGHIKIGDGAQIGAQAGVTKDVPPGSTVIGSPAMDAGRARRVFALVHRLPDIRDRFRELEKRVAELEKKAK